MAAHAITEPVRLCWFCREFWWSNASPGYSELTPGFDFSVSCNRDHWRFDSFTTSAEDFRKMLETAKTCPDFKLREGL